MARREWISLPYELARESGSRLDPMSLLEERDHLVIGLALRRLCRRIVITPRLASIPNFLLKAFLFLFLFVWFRQASPPGPTLGTLCSLGKFNQPFIQVLPSHSILLGHWSIISKSSPELPLPMRQLNASDVGRLERNIGMTANLADDAAPDNRNILNLPSVSKRD